MFLQKLKEITTFIFDVDGVLTNGDILASDSGEFLRTFNIKDGYALQLAVKRGFHVCIISGGKGQAMQKRFEGLGIKAVFLGVSDKVQVFHQYLEKIQTGATQVLYMGDDIPDLKVMKLVGLPTCPADAVPEIKAISQYISPYTGGKTAVRDVIEKVLRVQEQWFDEQPSAADSGK
ncbi:3-deoxy-D-manno-octulosonate 8-phosphate phosphatase (KDO 8-P phosphatase) [Pedobacter steynii]|uniref:3-deoxy-D-manno-octulosonate 8-phosphate phosphatase (KDO 8-P phosphatase) n=1 Tax=Pedobacter steynii TaxID=430522 RepID=A0A1G9YY24_9SPHI|nr:HAD-IIIA family hydrolase [Pedobacter steynii]NQX39852.1 HAD-IIIA family hydrolase [Pedobacter steynii]SDN13206.1 3-deoxy-D-manno-octulosonate 8-phosphate phosphatase (KDO 8-P phosphatase) [Pedobacter steynii]